MQFSSLSLDADVLQKLKTGPTHENVELAIAQVAMRIYQENAFHQCAKEAAEALGKGALEAFPGFLHHPPPKPKEAGDQFDALGEWLDICQGAIFRIAYFLKEAALPFIRKIAFGPYDWSQLRAISALARLAKDGIDTEQTISDLIENLPDFRYEAELPTYRAFAWIGKPTPEIRQLFYQKILQAVCNVHYWEAIELIELLQTFDKQESQVYSSFLEERMWEADTSYRRLLEDLRNPENQEKLMKGERISNSYSSTGLPWSDLHGIKATLVLYKLNPLHQEAQNRLQHWARTYPIEKIRNELSALILAKDESKPLLFTNTQMNTQTVRNQQQGIPFSPSFEICTSSTSSLEEIALQVEKALYCQFTSHQDSANPESAKSMIAFSFGLLLKLSKKKDSHGYKHNYTLRGDLDPKVENYWIDGSSGSQFVQLSDYMISVLHSLGAGTWFPPSY